MCSQVEAGTTVSLIIRRIIQNILFTMISSSLSFIHYLILTYTTARLRFHPQDFNRILKRVRAEIIILRVLRHVEYPIQRVHGARLILNNIIQLTIVIRLFDINEETIGETMVIHLSSVSISISVRVHSVRRNITITS
uniref:Uncharacterized protein n=1 Tax=Cacopsylla melanoneura TaxID=428564 RepID=A0A8D8SSJ3_9HEMI